MILSSTHEKRLISALILSICTMDSVQAQDKIEGDLTVDIVSSYIWLGQQLGHKLYFVAGLTLKAF